MSIQVNLSMKEIYKELCPKCKKKLEQMVRGKMEDEMVKKMLEEGGVQ